MKSASKIRLNKREVLVWTSSFVIVLTILAILMIGGDVYSSFWRLKEPPASAKVSRPIASEVGLGTIRQFSLSVPRLGVNAPIVPEVSGTNEQAYDVALNQGLAHYKGSALPGSGSNIFIFGHSSSVLGTGPYDKVFARLNYLQPGDIAEISFNGKPYQYQVDYKKIISANDTKVLEGTPKEQLTLMTCWPIGTDQKRLIVVARKLK